MAEKFSNLMKNTNLHIQGVHRSPSRIQSRQSTPRCMSHIAAESQRQWENLENSKRKATHSIKDRQ